MGPNIVRMQLYLHFPYHSYYNGGNEYLEKTMLSELKNPATINPYEFIIAIGGILRIF